MKTRQPQGFTAFELIVTMAIIAILLAAGVPAFKNYGWNLRMRTAMDTLQSDLNLARGRAISHNIQTVICPATDNTDCSGLSTWHDGWIIFTDLNGDRHKQPSEHLVRHAGRLALLNIGSSAARSYLRFYPNGSAPGSNTAIVFCDSRGAASAGTITVSNSGRIRAQSDGREPSEICP